MKFSLASITVLILLGLLISCNEDQPQIEDQNAHVQLHIWDNFAGNRIRITINDRELLDTTLTTEIPLAGPLHIVCTDLCYDWHHLNVRWWPVDPPSVTYDETYSFEVEEQSDYYIGLNCDGHELIIVVQTEPFLYL